MLLITAESPSKFIDARDKGNRTIFGDAAAACLVSKSDGTKYHLSFMGQMEPADKIL